jgi:hypothetical protein
MFGWPLWSAGRNWRRHPDKYEIYDAGTLASRLKTDGGRRHAGPVRASWPAVTRRN